MQTVLLTVLVTGNGSLASYVSKLNFCFFQNQ